MARTFRAVWDCHDTAIQRAQDHSSRPPIGPAAELRPQDGRISARRDDYAYRCGAHARRSCLSIRAMRTRDLQVDMTGLERAGRRLSARRHPAVRAASGVQRAAPARQATTTSVAYALRVGGQDGRRAESSRDPHIGSSHGQHAPANVGRRRTLSAWGSASRSWCARRRSQQDAVRIGVSGAMNDQSHQLATKLALDVARSIARSIDGRCCDEGESSSPQQSPGQARSKR